MATKNEKHIGNNKDLRGSDKPLAASQALYIKEIDNNYAARCISNPSNFFAKSSEPAELGV